MSTQGVLKTWNEQRGFGFIATSEGNQEIFVHISAFPRDGRRPQLGELLSFDIELNAQGRKAAVRVRRVGTPSPGGQPPRRERPDRRRSSRVSRAKSAVAGLTAVAIGFAGFNIWQGQQTAAQTPAALIPGAAIERITPNAAQAPAAFVCDGRQHCSQMRSYEEALFFLQNCPDTKMDGDNDGEPCEQQFRY